MNTSWPEELTLKEGDGLVIVDVQNDFLPGGSLAVQGGNKIIAPLNGYVKAAQAKGLPIFATRDWHPPNHCSFKEQGGPWPPHCVANSEGAQFSSDLNLPGSTIVISKGTEVEEDAYSGFEGTDLHERLSSEGISRVLVGGLATEYCVLNTVKDALKQGYQVLLLQDAIEAVNVQPKDGEKAMDEMTSLGAIPITLEMIS